MTVKILSILVAGVILSSSCRKAKLPDAVPAVSTGSAVVEFSNMIGNETMDMNNKWYKNQNGDSFKVSKFNYYISNIKFYSASGKVFVQPESYHLLEQSLPESLNISIADIPFDTYTGIEFTLGVDSLRNTSGAQSGALDPAKGMFWSWTTGYIMFKLEGVAPRSTQPGGVFMLHAGGFQGTNNVVQAIRLDFANSVALDNNILHVHIAADAQKSLGSPNPVDFSKTPVIMTAGTSARQLSENYRNMFSIKYTGTQH